MQVLPAILQRTKLRNQNKGSQAKTALFLNAHCTVKISLEMF